MKNQEISPFVSVPLLLRVSSLSLRLLRPPFSPPPLCSLASVPSFTTNPTTRPSPTSKPCRSDHGASQTSSDRHADNRAGGGYGRLCAGCAVDADVQVA